MINPYNRDTVVFFNVRESSHFGQSVAKPPRTPREILQNYFSIYCRLGR
eukprot:UN19141